MGETLGLKLTSEANETSTGPASFMVAIRTAIRSLSRSTCSSEATAPCRW